ncbi:MAG TPA: lyase [Dehalococcoidia bacterium]|nr:lyase [Dehalococcoidia bacterium]
MRLRLAAPILVFVLTGCTGQDSTGPKTAATPPATPAAASPGASPARQPSLLEPPAGGSPQPKVPSVPSPAAPAAIGAATPAASPAAASPSPSPSPSPGPAASPSPVASPRAVGLQEYAVPRGSGPHDVAPSPDGSVWYTAQRSGELGRLDPATSETRHVALGSGSAPHGVIVGPDDAPWVTDGGLNAIVRVDPATEEVKVFRLPADRRANLNTATFDNRGVLWFTGQAGLYGRLDPESGRLEVFDAPRGAGPYGITTTPDGSVYYASLAGSHIARIDVETGEATPIDPPTNRQGARRVWSDSRGRIWVSEWNAGQVGMYDPAANAWREWRLPGDRPQAYSVYVDERDKVWLTDFGSNAIVLFDPEAESFTSFPLPSPNANVRQMLGRPGEAWGAESGADKLVVIRY